MPQFDPLPRVGGRNTDPSIRPIAAAISRDDTAFPVANVTHTAITFQFEGVDTDEMVDLAAQPTRITVRTPGYYLVGGQASFVGSSAGERMLYVLRNGLNREARCSIPVNSGASSQYSRLNCCSLGPRFYAAGDYFQLVAYQDSGGSLDIREFPELWVARVAS